MQIVNTFIFTLFFLAIQGQLSIKKPENLKNQLQQGVMNFAIANFGFVPYGRNIKGNLFLQKNINTDFGCESIRKRKSDDQHFLVLKRSLEESCRPSLQAKNAEEAGYNLLVLIDYTQESLEYVNLQDDYFEDGKTMIPTILVSQQDGDLLIQFDQQETISVEIYFAPPFQSKEIVIDFYLDTMDQRSVEFLNNFSELYKEILKEKNGDQKLFFNPHFPTFECYPCEANNYTYNHPDCLGNGRYCSVDPDGSEGIKNQSGKDATYEKLRSSCVYQYTSLEQWLEYQIEFFAKCMNGNNLSYFLDDCTENILKKIGIQQNLIQSCINDSFYYENSEDFFGNQKPFSKEEMQNYILDSEKSFWEESNVPQWPALVVNNKLFRGDLNEQQATFEFICSGYVEEPEVCKSWDDWKFGEELPTPQTYKQYFWNSLLDFTIIAVCVACVIYLIVVCLRKQIKNDTDKHVSLAVNTAMSQYWALNDNSTTGRNDSENQK